MERSIILLEEIQKMKKVMGTNLITEAVIPPGVIKSLIKALGLGASFDASKIADDVWDAAFPNIVKKASMSADEIADAIGDTLTSSKLKVLFDIDNADLTKVLVKGIVDDDNAYTILKAYTKAVKSGDDATANGLVASLDELGIPANKIDDAVQAAEERMSKEAADAAAASGQKLAQASIKAQKLIDDADKLLAELEGESFKSVLKNPQLKTKVVSFLDRIKKAKKSGSYDSMISKLSDDVSSQLTNSVSELQKFAPNTLNGLMKRGLIKVKENKILTVIAILASTEVFCRITNPNAGVLCGLHKKILGLLDTAFGTDLVGDNTSSSTNTGNNTGGNVVTPPVVADDPFQGCMDNAETTAFKTWYKTTYPAETPDWTQCCIKWANNNITTAYYSITKEKKIVRTYSKNGNIFTIISNKEL